MPHKLTRAEQETIITRTADQSEWIVYTCDPVWKRRLAKVAEALKRSLTVIDRDGIELMVPIDWVRVSPPRRLTEAQRASAQAGLKAARAARETQTPVAALNP